MPSILCNRRFLFNSIGRSFSREQFEDICFQFGIELDGVLRASDVPSTAGTATGKSDMRQPPLDMNNFPGDDDEVYKIDCPANRYDLLSTEGLALALRSFLGIEKSPQFSLFPLKPTVSLYVKDSVKSVRDFIACAVLRNVSFTNDSFHSFIDYQEKLHLSLGRKRSLVSVGTHDLDKITTPLSYEAVTKEAIQFIPLKQTTTLDCSDDGLIQYYKDDKHINKYVSLISHFSSYPVVFDKNRSVLSLPPIINSQFSHMSQKTRNIFIECTGVDKAKTHIMLNLMVYAVATHCVNQFVIEPVEIQYENGTSELTPQIESRTITCDIERMKRQIGIPEEVSKQECCELLKKMQLISEIRNNEINVTVPFNRPDILHECDIMEDLAIAYGYNNLGNTGIQKSSVASQNPMEKLSHLLRLELACAGYCETLTLSLCSHDEAFKSLNRRDVGNVVKIANPQTQEFQVLRPSLLPGTLKTLASNQNYALPIQLFEISDVVCLDATQQTGAKNKRHLSALYCNTDCSGFEAIHGLLDYIMTKLDIPDTKYYILETENPTYLQGRSVQVFLRKNSPKPIYIGELGVLHPDVLLHYQILNPCAYIELNLEELL